VTTTSIRNQWRRECPRQGLVPTLTNLSASAVPNASARRAGTDPTVEVKQGAAPAALHPFEPLVTLGHQVLASGPTSTQVIGHRAKHDGGSHHAVHNSSPVRPPPALSPSDRLLGRRVGTGRRSRG
jgi:hypothetical protein